MINLNPTYSDIVFYNKYTEYILLYINVILKERKYEFK